MNAQDWIDINWTAVLVGFGVDWAFSLPVGLVVSAALLALKGSGFDSQEWPADVVLAGQIVGLVGAILGGGVAGYIARRRGSLHGLLASLFSLVTSLCLFGLAPDLGDVGFIVLNLIGASYGGGMAERWRARRGGKS